MNTIKHIFNNPIQSVDESTIIGMCALFIICVNIIFILVVKFWNERELFPSEFHTASSDSLTYITQSLRILPYNQLVAV